MKDLMSSTSDTIIGGISIGLSVLQCVHVVDHVEYLCVHLCFVVVS